MIADTMSRRRRIALTGIRILVAFAFLLAGGAKLIGVPMMVTVFEHVGLGQWFRYLTGAIEVGGALLLLAPRFAGAAALLLAATMVGAVLAHLTVVPGSPLPAAVLLVLCATLAWSYRGRTLALLGAAPSRRVPA